MAWYTFWRGEALAGKPPQQAGGTRPAQGGPRDPTRSPASRQCWSRWTCPRAQARARRMANPS